MTVICIFFLLLLYIELFFMGVLYKRYVDLLRLLKSSDVEELTQHDTTAYTQVVSCYVRQYPEPAKNLSDLSLIARGRDVVFCSEVLISSRCHISELMVPGFGSPMQLIRSAVGRFRELAVYVRDGFSAYGQRSYECGYCEVIVFKICSSSHNFNVFGVYRNPDLSGTMFDYLLTTIAKVQSVDRKAFFQLIGNVKAHREE